MTGKCLNKEIECTRTARVVMPLRRRQTKRAKQTVCADGWNKCRIRGDLVVVNTLAITVQRK